VSGLEPGDEVYGEVDGTFAEYVCVPDDMVARKPANLTFEQAAALPLAGNTALIDLREVAAGQRVLINGASGGVGTMAVQLAKARGADVTGVCSTRNSDLVRSLGADHVVDYTKDDFTRDGRQYDLILDLVGNRSLTDLRRALTPDGTLVLSGGGTSNGGSLIGPYSLFLKGRVVARFVRYRLLFLEARQSKKNLDDLREFAEAGTLVPVIEQTYPLSKAAEAIRHVEIAHARAKVVVTT
jgi:NADPH:quinone reductase-like Zn-dependent oxidoreductase